RRFRRWPRASPPIASTSRAPPPPWRAEKELPMASTTKVAVITGAGSGIGKASSLALMRNGWSVVLAGRRKELLEDVAREGQATGSRSLVVPTDVADAAAISNLFARTKETFGRLDLLFNNAG